MPIVVRPMSFISRPFAVIAVAAALTLAPVAVEVGMTDVAYAKGKGGDKGNNGGGNRGGGKDRSKDSNKGKSAGKSGGSTRGGGGFKIGGKPFKQTAVGKTLNGIFKPKKKTVRVTRTKPKHSGWTTSGR